MLFKDFVGGLNTYDPPDNIAPNEFETLENVAYEEGSLLMSRCGLSLERSASSVRSVYPFYVSSSLHLLYTASGGLYDNGSVIDSSFTGVFYAAEHDNMVYLCNGSKYVRYDGSTVYNVGMDAPATPTVAADTSSTKVLEDFEGSPAGGAWTMASSPFDGGGSGTVGLDAVTYVEGAGSVKVTVPEDTKVKITKVFTNVQDWSVFSDGDSSTEDFITFKVYVENPDDLRYFQVLVDVDDGDFDTNYYMSGKVIQGVRYETTITRRRTGSTGGKGGGRRTYKTFKTTTEIPYSNIDMTEVVLNEGSGGWSTFKMSKADFIKDGDDSTKDWSTVKGLGFVIWAKETIASDPLTVYIDDGKMRGNGSTDGSFYGTYYFCASYYNSTRDEYYEVSEESEGVECDLQGVVVSSIPGTFPDAQANKYLVWVRREDWDNWFLVATVSEGTTTTTISYDDGTIITKPELTEQAGIYPLPKMLQTGEVKTRGNSNNSKPPVPDFVVKHRGKMVSIVDGAIYHSKPGMPWAVPADYWLEATSSSDPVQGMYSDGTNLTVHSKTRDFNYINVGEYDGAGMYMGYMAEGRRTVGCVSPSSISSGLYASYFGISTFDGQDGLTLSTKVKPSFRALSGKSSLCGAMFEELYLLVSSGSKSLVMEMEGIDEGQGTRIRFFEWSFGSTARCCVVDGITNTLYIGTDTGVYKYDRSTYKDSEGNFTFKAHTKVVDFGAENMDEPLQSASVLVNTGGNTLTVEFWVDYELYDSQEVSTTEKEEVELQLDMGMIGSFFQLKMEGTITEDAPIRIYQVEVS